MDAPAPAINPFNGLTRAHFEAMSKDQLIKLLDTALKTLTVSLQNTQTLTDLCAAANAKIKQLEDEKQSQEAELIVLRNRP